MRLIISAVIWEQYLLSGMCQLELVPLADKYGCAGIEFRPYWRSAVEELPEIPDFLAEYGLVCTYACNEGVLSATEAATRQSLAAMAASLLAAERLGAGLLRINVGAEPIDRAFLAADWWRQAMSEVIELAAARKITLAVENGTGRQNGDPLLIRDIIDTFGSPWLKATFDTGNWLLAGHEPAQALAMIGEHIGYVHLKDMVKGPAGYVPCYLGSGILDVRGLVDTLERSGYQGLYALEFPGGQSPAVAVKASLKFLGEK